MRLGIILGCLLLVGCAGMQVNEAGNYYTSYLNPQIGTQAKQTLLQSWGPPQSSSVIEGTEVWQYYRSYGNIGGTQSFNYKAGTTQPGFAMNVERERYDLINCAFDSQGTLLWWRANVQR